MPDHDLTSFDNRRLYFCQILGVWPKVRIHQFEDTDCEEALIRLKSQS